MLYRVCVPFISLRADASSRSELGSQLLFGDYFRVIDFNSAWLQVENIRDAYTGFIDSSPEAFIEVNEKGPHTLAQSLICMRRESLVKTGKFKFYVSLGSTRLTHGDFSYFNSDWQYPYPDFENALQLIKRELLGSPYLWGGKTNFGIDCSGFVQLYGYLFGKSLPRDASQQASSKGIKFSFEEMQRGDLVFFKNAENKIHHTGIYLGKEEIIHASVKVKIEKITPEGIINDHTKQISHIYAGFSSVSEL